jgi:hypothetical protein
MLPTPSFHDDQTNLPNEALVEGAEAQSPDRPWNNIDQVNGARHCYSEEPKHFVKEHL